MKRFGNTRRRGLSVVEALAVVIVVAVAIPPMTAAVTAHARHAVDTRARTEAAWLASAVLETVVADAESGDPDRSAGAMDDPAYVNDPSAGLRTRLSKVTATYAARGMDWSFSVGPLLDASGAPAGDGDAYARRDVTVEVTVPSARGGSVVIPFETTVVQR